MKEQNCKLHSRGATSHLRRALLGSAAVAACLVSGRVSAADASSPAGSGIQEITVTAQRREEKLQDVPIAVQALTGESLKELNIENFDDMTGYLPNVTTSSFGPGETNVYIRGLTVGAGGLQGGGATEPFPNVAIYLDDQSAQLPGRNLDLYAVDLQRVEVLEGPQGTLFGAGAEAGVVRYITNKPKLDVTEAQLNAGAAGGIHSAMSNNADGMLNIPLIGGTAAMRVVAYNDTRGGYINNVPGTFTRKSTDGGIYYAGYTNNIPGPATPVNSANNASLVGKNINPVTYQGVRGEILWKFNDDWNALISESFQNMDAEGVFYETPIGVDGVTPLKPLSVQMFNPSYNRDKFENTALTVNGRIGDLDVVYNGSYLVRDVTQVQDYTNYARGVYADYYQCLGPTKAFPNRSPQCYSPSATWRDTDHDTHLSQELRVSTPTEWRIRGTAGFFWEKFQVEDNADWGYATAPGYTSLGAVPGATMNDPNIRSNNISFFDDITRGYTQTAEFASVEYDIIPKVLFVSAGTRHYSFSNTEVGAKASGFGCGSGPYGPYTGSAPCDAGATNIDAEGLKSTYSGFKSRANITWKVTPDEMVYYTFSQGFRPGGFNRVSNGTQYAGFKTPIKYAPDSLTNNEVGYKTTWFDHRLELDGAVYEEEWDNVQASVFDPGVLGNLTMNFNGANYRVIGTESQVVAKPIPELTLSAGGAVNQSNQLNSPFLVGQNGVVLTQVPNPWGKINSSLAQSPLLKVNARARYEFVIDDYLPFFQIGIVHSSHSHTAASQVVPTYDYIEPAYTTVDIAMGVSKDKWSIQAYCDNLTNTLIHQFESDTQFIPAIYPNRPLTAGVKFSYTFN